MTTKIYYPLNDIELHSVANTNSWNIIKWLRSQGDRGIDFEFAGSGKSLSIWFMNEKLEMVYLLRWH